MERGRVKPGWLADHPDLMAQWHPTRNTGIDPETIRAGSGRRVWWQCERGHEWQTIVGNRTRKGCGCPMCLGRRASDTYNLAVVHPQAAATWHPTRNAPLRATEITPDSSRRVWWRCAAGHEWQVAVTNRIRHECPFCSGNRVTPETSLAALHPGLAQEWHPTRNGIRSPETVTARAGTPVWWLCGRCGHEWQAKPDTRARGAGCRVCAWAYHRRATEPLTVTHPDVAAQWHPTANGGATPDRITYGSHRQVWWSCDRGHAWETTVTSRTSGRSRCPYCTGQRAWRNNSFAVAAPDLAAEWHPTRNGSLRPEHVTPRSSRLVWWQCAAGHEWQGQPLHRQQETRGCPYCTGRWATAETSLAALVPALAAEWHPTHNGTLRPEDVTRASSRRVWWRCATCGHDWVAAINNRTHSGGSRCPVCARKADAGKPRPRRTGKA